jgi:hypothetical protein
MKYLTDALNIFFFQFSKLQKTDDILDKILSIVSGNRLFKNSFCLDDALKRVKICLGKCFQFSLRAYLSGAPYGAKTIMFWARLKVITRYKQMKKTSSGVNTGINHAKLDVFQK